MLLLPDDRKKLTHNNPLCCSLSVPMEDYTAKYADKPDAYFLITIFHPRNGAADADYDSMMFLSKLTHQCAATMIAGIPKS